MDRKVNWRHSYNPLVAGRSVLRANPNRPPAKYNVVIAPKGAKIPDDIGFPTKTDGDLVDRLNACAATKTIITISVRELQILTEYRDLFDIDICAVIGLSAPLYNSLWNTFVSVMERVTVEGLMAEAEAVNDERSNHGQLQIASPALRRREFYGVSGADDDAAGGSDTPDDDDQST